MSSKLNFFIYKIFSTWFYLGTFKYFPGTIGSIASLPFAALIVNYGGNFLLIFFKILFFFIGVKISDKYSIQKQNANNYSHNDVHHNIPTLFVFLKFLEHFSYHKNNSLKRVSVLFV